MDKHELISLTLDRLFDHFKASPESFQYMDSDSSPHKALSPTITWRPRIQLKDSAGTLIDDPNNDHAVILCYNLNLNEFSCYVFLKAPMEWSGSKADSVVTTKRYFHKLSRNYRRFIKLRNLIRTRDQHKDNLRFLNKLSSVFPDTLDDVILKD